MKKIFLFLIFVSNYAFSEVEIENIKVPDNKCTLELFAKVYRLDANQLLTANDLIQKTTCEPIVLSKFSQIISSATGTISSDVIKRELSRDFSSITIDIVPRKISIIEINNTFRDQLTADSNLFFLNTKSLNGLKTLGLVDGEQLKVSCESCSNFGEKNIKTEISNPILSTSRALWFSSQIMAKIKIFKARRNLSFQQKHLEKEDFYADEILSKSPENALTSLENINFYKPNRTIVEGAVISNQDIQAVNLINFGTPVQVILKNININLQRTAMPTRSALFGEIIELRNPNNNKIIAGKVVDYNKVVIEL
jgi:flagella basal body P-ring formation protein FlgA